MGFVPRRTLWSSKFGDGHRSLHFRAFLGLDVCGKSVGVGTYYGQHFHLATCRAQGAFSGAHWDMVD